MSPQLRLGNQWFPLLSSRAARPSTVQNRYVQHYRKVVVALSAFQRFNIYQLDYPSDCRTTLSTKQMTLTAPVQPCRLSPLKLLVSPALKPPHPPRAGALRKHHPGANCAQPEIGAHDLQTITPQNREIEHQGDGCEEGS